jgi:hypothetical protein
MIFTLISNLVYLNSVYNTVKTINGIYKKYKRAKGVYYG